MNTQTAKLIKLLNEIKTSDQEDIPDIVEILRGQYNLRKALPVVHGVLGNKYDSLLFNPSSVGSNRAV